MLRSCQPPQTLNPKPYKINIGGRGGSETLAAVQVFVENAVAALPHDAHFMGIILTAINALSTGHPEQNPALAGQDIYKSKEIQDKQIVRLIGDLPPSQGPSPEAAKCNKTGHAGRLTN